MRQSRIITYIYAAIFTGCIFLCSCENDPKEVSKINQRILGVEEARDIRIVYTTAGRSKAVLFSPLMLRVQDTVPYIEFPNRLNVDFYNAAEVMESKLAARYAKYKENQNTIFLRDSVKVFNILKGDTLYCDELYWDRNRVGNEFYTEKPVRIRTRTQILNGIGMVASQDFKAWKIIRPTGIITVPASQFPQ